MSNEVAETFFLVNEQAPQHQRKFANLKFAKKLTWGGCTASMTKCFCDHY